MRFFGLLTLLLAISLPLAASRLLAMTTMGPADDHNGLTDVLAEIDHHNATLKHVVPYFNSLFGEAGMGYAAIDEKHNYFFCAAQAAHYWGDLKDPSPPLVFKLSYATRALIDVNFYALQDAGPMYDIASMAYAPALSSLVLLLARYPWDAPDPSAKLLVVPDRGPTQKPISVPLQSQAFRSILVVNSTTYVLTAINGSAALLSYNLSAPDPKPSTTLLSGCTSAVLSNGDNFYLYNPSTDVFYAFAWSTANETEYAGRVWAFTASGSCKPLTLPLKKLANIGGAAIVPSAGQAGQIWIALQISIGGNRVDNHLVLWDIATQAVLQDTLVPWAKDHTGSPYLSGLTWLDDE